MLLRKTVTRNNVIRNFVIRNFDIRNLVPVPTLGEDANSSPQIKRSFGFKDNMHAIFTHNCNVIGTWQIRKMMEREHGSSPTQQLEGQKEAVLRAVRRGTRQSELATPHGEGRGTQAFGTRWDPSGRVCKRNGGVHGTGRRLPKGRERTEDQRWCRGPAREPVK